MPQSSSKKKFYIVKQVETLFGSPWELVNKEKHWIHIKEYRWNFKFILPSDIPPSLNTCHGKTKIEYILKAHVKIPKRKSIKYKEFITVGAHYKEPLAMPIFTKDETAPFVSKKRKLSLSAVLLKSVTFSQDDYSFEVNLENSLPQTLKYMEVQLIKYLKSGAKTSKKIIGRYTFIDGFPLRKGESYSGLLNIKMPPNMLPTCAGSMIQITYHIRIKARINSLKTASISAPILVSSFEQRV